VRFVSTVGGDPKTRMLTEVAGGDPGYFDDLSDLAGQLTPVQAMGDALLARLQQAGMTFRAVAPD
jgi:hypothetical protein